MQCHVSRNAEGLSISYSKNGVALGTAFQLQARCKGLRLSTDCIVVVVDASCSHFDKLSITIRMTMH